MLAAAWSAAALVQTPAPQTPPVPTVNETVVVSAREAGLIADAVRMLKRSEDRFLSTTVADHVEALANALAIAGRTFQLGPLTASERRVIDLGRLLRAHTAEDGPIRLTVRGDGDEALYRLTRSSFMAFVADLAEGDLLRVRIIQQTKMLVTGRLIQDLNAQAGAVIPEREIVAGIIRGLAAADARGVIAPRVMDVSADLAESGQTYDFVPKARLADFSRWTSMSEGDLFTPVPALVDGAINVTHGGRLYSTTIEHFAAFFVRFLFADPRLADWSRQGKGVELGGKILDYLVAQLQADALTGVRKVIDGAGAIGPEGLLVGDTLARGPAFDIVRQIPGLTMSESPLGPGYRRFVVHSSDASKIPELRKWIAGRLKKLPPRPAPLRPLA
jgi:hypothetical protein